MKVDEIIQFVYHPRVDAILVERVIRIKDNKGILISPESIDYSGDYDELNHFLVKR